MRSDRLGSLLGSKYARILTLVLIAQGIGLFAISRREHVPLTRPLEEFPGDFDKWRSVQDGVIEKEVMDVLRADDVLTRVYADAETGRIASLFIAYFKSQRTGQAPHSPKNCLPGSGWVPSESEVIAIPVSGAAAPIRVNRYVVARGDEKSAVLYWYQTRDRVIASEYTAKIFLVLDAIRYNRSDTALVRVVVPIANNQTGAATDAAVRFVQAFFPELQRHLPG
jgi:EpsI family protein